MISDRKVARITGILFLSAFATYGPGSALVESLVNSAHPLLEVAANEMRLRVGALLMLANSAVVVGIGILLLPVLKRHDGHIAYGYLGTRLLEAVILIVGVIGLLSLVPMGRELVAVDGPGTPFHRALGSMAIQWNSSAYQIAMAVLAFGSLFFCYLLYRTRLVPRLLSAWGFTGYAILLAGSLAELLGNRAGLIPSIPGGLFELTFGVWLITKGFAPSIGRPASTV